MAVVAVFGAKSLWWVSLNDAGNRALGVVVEINAALNLSVSGVCCTRFLSNGRLSIGGIGRTGDILGFSIAKGLGVGLANLKGDFVAAFVLLSSLVLGNLDVDVFVNNDGLGLGFETFGVFTLLLLSQLGCFAKLVLRILRSTGEVVFLFCSLSLGLKAGSDNFSAVRDLATGLDNLFRGFFLFTLEDADCKRLDGVNGGNSKGDPSNGEASVENVDGSINFS